jgi:hypothetical protein
VIVEVDHYFSVSLGSQILPELLTIDCQPFILILPLGKLHNLPQTSTTQCSLRILSQLVTRRALVGISWSELVPCPLITITIIL